MRSASTIGGGPQPNMLCPLQLYYQTSQGFGVVARPDFNPATASHNDGQLGRVPALRCHLDCGPPRHLILTGSLPTIPGPIPRQRFQRYSALIAELPLAEPARFTVRRQPVGFFTASPPPSLLLSVHTPTASNARAAWKDVVGLTDTQQRGFKQLQKEKWRTGCEGPVP